mmetsp:Transcript_25319/g.19067  ORF Transcript_25319/g.19067 Transcript_25319/m.19067 type:complete len:240 (-) Transcript_25319:291-1010(-)
MSARTWLPTCISALTSSSQFSEILFPALLLDPCFLLPSSFCVFLPVLLHFHLLFTLPIFHFVCQLLAMQPDLSSFCPSSTCGLIPKLFSALLQGLTSSGNSKSGSFHTPLAISSAEIDPLLFAFCSLFGLFLATGYSSFSLGFQLKIMNFAFQFSKGQNPNLEKARFELIFFSLFSLFSQLFLLSDLLFHLVHSHSLALRSILANSLLDVDYFIGLILAILIGQFIHFVCSFRKGWIAV